MSSSSQLPLSIEGVHPAVKAAQYAVRGRLLDRAGELERELAAGGGVLRQRVGRDGDGVRHDVALRLHRDFRYGLDTRDVLRRELRVGAGGPEEKDRAAEENRLYPNTGKQSFGPKPRNLPESRNSTRRNR